MILKDVIENMGDWGLVEVWVEVCGITFRAENFVNTFKSHPGILDKEVVRVNHEVYPPRVITR